MFKILLDARKPGITITLVGARNTQQAVQDARAVDASLTSDELGFITAELNKLELVRQ
ncbi:hypothetical protein [Parapedobacter tibetensis]|uniref:hypothetical protein n=1 Tax=Parapedobacter tibetensis TaxID=2972951 RepID=UPI00214D4FD8|nr:hypothetical protein [Parapedobacter tibetensis]